jgi:hypothetical protein
MTLLLLLLLLLLPADAGFCTYQCWLDATLVEK